MNVFHKITRKSLAKNRTRTIVTIIGIILSMALFTAVIEGAYSGVQYLIRSEIDATGAYHGFYDNVEPGQIEGITQQDALDSYAVCQLVGWGRVLDAPNEKPQLAIGSISDNFTDLVSVKLHAGRMPETPQELIVPQDMTGYSVGDTVTLSVGTMVSDGMEWGLEQIYTESEPELRDAEPRTYTIVGTYRPLDYSYNSLALTRGDAAGKANVYFTIDHLSDYYRDFLANQTFDGAIVTHYALLLYSGVTGNDNLMTVLYGLVTILVLLIAFGSVSLIYNSFSISVSERTRQFGILKSIGATKCQLRRSVFYEAAILSAIGIPLGLLLGCTGIGITLYCLQDDFARMMVYQCNVDVKIGLVLNPTALITAALICLATVLISAWIPAKRSAKVNPIEAVRQSNDIRIKGSKVRTSKLTQKLFGFAGMMAAKNFKRNRKRYRSTVISLFMSIVLFISATAFCSYLTSTVEGVSSSRPEAQIYYYTTDDRQPEQVMELLSSAAGVTDGMYMRSCAAELFTDPANIDPSYLNRPYGYLNAVAEGLEASMNAHLAFINDEQFRQLCRDNGIDPAAYFDTNAPVALLYNNVVEPYRMEPDDPFRWYTCKNLMEDKLPCTLTQIFYQPNREPDLVFYDLKGNEEGPEYAVYYPDSVLEEYYAGEAPELDESKAVLIPVAEAETQRQFTVNAVIEKPPFSLTPDTPAVVYPLSMLPFVVDEAYVTENLQDTICAFISDNHHLTYTEMEQLLENRGMETDPLWDEAEGHDAQMTIVMVVRVFSYGFIILISLIALANVFNSVSTGIMLRRREFAVLRSIGLDQKGFYRMMNYECLIFGFKSIVYGLPVSFLLCYAIYRTTSAALQRGFYVPWLSVVIAVGSVFLVVFATMLYATGKIRKDNPMDALKNENI